MRFVGCGSKLTLLANSLCTSPQVWSSGATNPILESLNLLGGFADGAPVQNGRVRIPDTLGIGIEEKSRLIPLFERMVLSRK
jgi:hypothetical protein